MKCVKCSTELVTRKGKYGEFYACPKSNPSDNHGTVSSVLVSKVYKEQRYAPVIDLDTLIQQKMMPYIGRMTDLDLFVEGVPDSDDSEHWMNTRPY